MYNGIPYVFIYVFNVTIFQLVFTVSHPESNNVNDINCQSQTNIGRFPNKRYVIMSL